jgi:COMPASS component SWD2
MTDTSRNFKLDIHATFSKF